MHWGRVAKIAIPFAAIDAVMMGLPEETLFSSGFFILPALALVVTGAAARRGAAWREIIGGFGLGAVAVALWTGRIEALWYALYACGPGVWLAPALSGPVRKNPALALPVGVVFRAALGLLLCLGLLIAATAGEDAAVIGAAMLTGFALIPASLSAGVLALVGEERASAWVGAVASAAWLLAYAVLICMTPPV